jgi:hypothetical protein
MVFCLLTDTCLATPSLTRTLGFRASSCAVMGWGACALMGWDACAFIGWGAMPGLGAGPMLGCDGWGTTEALAECARAGRGTGKANVVLLIGALVSPGHIDWLGAN